MSTSFKKSKKLEFTDYYITEKLLAVLPWNARDCYSVKAYSVGDMPIVELTPSSNPTGWDNFEDEYDRLTDECMSLWDDDGYYY